MTNYSSEKSVLGKLITWIVVAIVAIAALKLAFWAIGMMVGIGSFLLFTLGPIVLVGWLVMKLVRGLNGRPRDHVEW